MHLEIGHFGPFHIEPLHEDTATFSVMVFLRLPEDTMAMAYGSGHLNFLHREVGEYGRDWFFKDQFSDDDSKTRKPKQRGRCVYFQDFNEALNYALRWTGP